MWQSDPVGSDTVRDRGDRAPRSALAATVPGARPLIARFSQHLVNLVDRPLGRAASGADREDAVEPVVARRGGLEHDRGAEIVLRRIDRFAAIETLHDFRWPVP